MPLWCRSARRPGAHSVPQEETNRLLVDYAKAGNRVVRLKGGDPFMFGRGGEELEVLADEGIPFSVVPGITAAAGATAYAGIPLTHRDYAQSAVFITGHCQIDGKEPDWQQLAATSQTLVIYMGLMRSEHIQQQLVRSRPQPSHSHRHHRARHHIPPAGADRHLGRSGRSWPNRR